MPASVSSTACATPMPRSAIAELTGRLAPAAGGTQQQGLTPEEKAQDLAARLQISHEMGHEREQITVVYLGR